MFVLIYILYTITIHELSLRRFDKSVFFPHKNKHFYKPYKPCNHCSVVDLVLSSLEGFDCSLPDNIVGMYCYAMQTIVISCLILIENPNQY